MTQHCVVPINVLREVNGRLMMFTDSLTKKMTVAPQKTEPVSKTMAPRREADHAVAH